MKNTDPSPLQKAGHEFVQLVQPLFADHAFLTIICAFLAVMMTLSFYRFLKSINPALVAFIMFLIFGMLMLHWTITRTEPAILRPVVEWIAPFFPSSTTYPDVRGKPIPAKPAPAKPKRGAAPKSLGGPARPCAGIRPIRPLRAQGRARPPRPPITWPRPRLRR